MLCSEVLSCRDESSSEMCKSTKNRAWDSMQNVYGTVVLQRKRKHIISSSICKALHISWMQRCITFTLVNTCAILWSIRLTEEVYTLSNCRDMIASKDVGTIIFLNGEDGYSWFVFKTSYNYRLPFRSGAGRPLKWNNVMMYSTISAFPFE